MAKPDNGDKTPHQTSLLARIRRARPTGKRRLPKPPKPVQPLSIERWYVRQLQHMIDVLHNRVKEKLIPKLAHYRSQAPKHFTGVKNDDLMSEVFGEVAEIRVYFSKSFTDKALSNIAGEAFAKMSDLNAKNIKGQMQAVLGVDIFLNDGKLLDLADTFIAENVRRIKKNADKYCSDLNQTIYDGFAEGLRWEEIAEDIQDRYDVSQWDSERLARDQVSKLNGQLTQERQTEIGVTSYVWRTSLDDRVRPEHEAKEGETYEWDDPPAGTGHPGEDIMCRCWAEPILDDLI